MSDTDKTLLETLIERHAALATEAQTILDTVETETRSLTEDEETRSADLFAQMKDLKNRIDMQEAIERSRHIANEAAAKVTITNEPHEYRADNAVEGVSYFKDLANMNSNHEAQERLSRHAKNVLEYRTGSSTNGAGGEFTPPQYLLEDWAAYLRYASPMWNAMTQVDLPDAGNFFSVPKISLGTEAGVTAELATNPDRDIETDSVTATVVSIASNYSTSLKSIERSPGGTFDKAVLADMAAEYGLQKDIYLINYLLGLAGTNAVTYTSSSPTQSGLFPVLAQGVSQIAKARKLAQVFRPTTFMTESRWLWLAAGTDTTGRPLIGTTGLANFNALGSNGDPASQGPVGKLAIGSDVVTDGSIPSSDGVTPIIQAITNDVWVMDSGDPIIEVFRAAGNNATTNSVTYRAYGYATALVRYPEAVAVISGTGLADPAGY